MRRGKAKLLSEKILALLIFVVCPLLRFMAMGTGSGMLQLGDLA